MPRQSDRDERTPPSAAKQERVVGQRSPDETGMLAMLPVWVGADARQAAVDPSATAFFALPPPRPERAPATPTAPINRPPAPPAEARVRSTRAYAIVFAMFVLVCLSVLIAAWFDEVEPAPAAPVPPPPVPTLQPAVPTPTEAPPVPPRQPRTKRTTPVASAPSTAPSDLIVALSDATQATSVEVVCASGFRDRATVSGGRARVANVPAESCTLYFHGGPPAKFGPVRGGTTLTCNIVETTAVCN